MSKLPDIDESAVVKLLPVLIPKPWGQEIWYSGMEARGQSQVQIDGRTIDLETYLQAAPDTTNHQPLLLLKVLDPTPQPVLGDLYFEVHEEKQEVYVVTHVDDTAWPDGHGEIRFGMNQQRRKSYADDAAFRVAYREAVAHYERTRRQIDVQLGERDLSSLANDATGARLIAEEQAARAAMESFTAVRKLVLGDVIKVPTWTPHALQHGVRVVEFQTQTYERYIISFAQKVLTQDHWDTTFAVQRMHLDAPAIGTFEAVAEGIERIARFEDFNVWRCEGRAPISLPGHIPYCVVMALGETTVGNLVLQAEEACLVPHAAVNKTQITTTHQVLLAAPGL